MAVVVLLEAADGAREFEDLHLRASILTFCADALWLGDEQAARSVFRRAWTAATEADEAELKEGAGDSSESPTRARHPVLTLAAKRDARLADEFLREMREWLEDRDGVARVASNLNASRDLGPPDESTPNGQRLALASSLLSEEESERAAEFAAPSLAGGVSGANIDFLLRLREQTPVEADRLFLALLDRTRADAEADANDVLLLSSYVLTPHLLVVVDRSGSVQLRPWGAVYGFGVGSAPLPERPVRLRAAFYDTAATILLRVAPVVGGAGGASSGEMVAVYFAVGRLLPFFEREATQYAPALRARLAALAAGIEATRRDALSNQMKLRSLSSENRVDPLAARMEALKNTKDERRRDEIRLNIVQEAARLELWDRARQFAADISDEGLRRAAMFVIAARQVAGLFSAFETDDDGAEQAAAFARNTDLPPAVRALGFAQAAALASRRGKRVLAAELLDEALGYAEQTEAGTTTRAAACLMTASFAARLGSPRAWEVLTNAVAAVNADEEFNGNLVSFDLQPDAAPSNTEMDVFNDIFGTFPLDELFALMAQKDFARATAEARTLKQNLSRTISLMAAARAALEKNRRARAAGAR